MNGHGSLLGFSAKVMSHTNSGNNNFIRTPFQGFIDGSANRARGAFEVNGTKVYQKTSFDNSGLVFGDETPRNTSSSSGFGVRGRNTSKHLEL